MKKIISILTCVGLLAVITGCGSKNSDLLKIYTRDATSGTREAFEVVGDFKGKLSKEAIEVTSNDDMANKVGSDTNGVGYVSLSTDFEKNNVKPISFEGVVASNESVIDKSYKMQRPFNFVSRAKGDYDTEAKEQLVAAFVDYVQKSKEGMLIVEKNGGIVDHNQGTEWAILAQNHPITTKDNSGITINTVGSTSVEKSIKAALQSFVPLAGNFKFTMNHSGSGDGYKRVLGSEKDGPNKGDLGFASRAFENEEDVSIAMMQGSYCVDAVVAIVNNNNNNLNDLTATSLKDIFTGVLTKWTDIKN